MPVRIWRLPVPLRCVSSASLGGGLGVRSWVLNATVPRDYSCEDPARDLAAIAAAAGLGGDGVALMTAVDVRNAAVVCHEGVVVDATVGVSMPTWAADAADAADAHVVEPARVGTINVVAFLPERLSDAALVNAVGTVTEAKAQALFEAGIAGTGTVTDAVCLLCPSEGDPHPYGGPRSFWGTRLARAVHRAVLDGLTLSQDGSGWSAS
ncbi:MAG TPA: adenosylcobinamide amidohydrolase [Acidimicrobiales bacterium]|nr:adenosylcobinamide amidohydrolase [Acidimicrobiales bacterium]